MAAPRKTPKKSVEKSGARPSALAEATARSRANNRSRTQRSGAVASSARPEDRAPIKKNLAHRLYLGEAGYDFIGNRKKWYLVSAAVIAICLASLLFRGLNLGIEFKGGTTFNVPVSQVTGHTVNEYGKVVEATGLPELDGTSVVTLGQHTARVQTRSLTPEEVVSVRAALAKEAGTTADKVAYSTVGASWGKQITEKGVQALVVFMVLVGLMIWAYFRDWKMSIGAIVAVLHDLVVTVGVYSLLGFTVSPATLIGVLTILGYSLYDTVVVFDKVRENVKNITRQSHTYSEQTNLAINQVLVRSINTTIIGVLPVAALLIAAMFFMGPGPIEDLGLALFVGMIAGAYSSIFIAAPLNAQLREMEPEIKAHTARLGRREARHARGSKASADEVAHLREEPADTAAATVRDTDAESPWELEGVEVDEAALVDEMGEDGGDIGPAPAAVRRPSDRRPRQNAAGTRTTRKRRK